MGPLAGIRILEIAGLGPTQLCGMLLSDMGAEVVRVERVQPGGDRGFNLRYQDDLMNRGRPSLGLDLKSSTGRDTLLRLCESADALFEGFRPGVMERLGLGPDECLNRNPKLVYGRMTGWGQEGPLSQSAGHDPNYLAVAGVLGALGESDRLPPLPLNLIGDGAGAVYLAMGILAALLDASRSGQGQVVDAAMVDSSISLLTPYFGMLAGGRWADERSRDGFDGSLPWLRTYRTRDDRYVAVAALEDRFYAELVKGLGLSATDLPVRSHPENIPGLTRCFEAAFATRTRDEWAAHFADTDACVSPVLSLGEATQHPQLRDRKSFIDVAGKTQPAPAPRFSRTPSEVQGPPRAPGSGGDAVLKNWGFSAQEIEKLIAEGAVACAEEGPK